MGGEGGGGEVDDGQPEVDRVSEQTEEYDLIIDWIDSKSRGTLTMKPKCNSNCDN